MALRTSFVALALSAASIFGCAGNADSTDGQSNEPVLGSVNKDAALTITRTPTRVFGSVADNGATLKFSSEEIGGVVEVKVEVNGVVLTAKYTAEEAAFDGVNAADGTPALLTGMDRAAVGRALAALEAELHPSIAHVKSKEEYDAVRHLTAAEERLYNVLDAEWSQWPTAIPLKRDIKLSEVPHGWTSYRRYAATNTTVTGCHDCNSCSWSGDCCDSGYKVGEYFNGANYGNCGTSDTGSQFTKDCTNHDQCVRTSKHGGHALASLYCDDQFTSCVDDEAFASSCKYDWRGSSYKGNCPSSWNGTGDGCDCFCQFQDADCSL